MSPGSTRASLKRFFMTKFYGRTGAQDVRDNSSSYTREANESTKSTRGDDQASKYSHEAAQCTAAQGSHKSTPSNTPTRNGSQPKITGFSNRLDQESSGRSRTWPEDASNPMYKGVHAFNNAHDFVMMNPTMILGEGSGDRLNNVMKFLSENIIVGAAHDDSARDPPPRCHPSTRIQVLEQITAWFFDEIRRRLILWINGPAGVGKSAILQTFAEILAKSKHLGASVFVSRPNGRNDPRRLFITIAYQLALRIEDYRTYVVELLNLNPDVINKDLREQFRSFIIKPFVGKRIGAGGKPWCILLDGLDELDGQGHQRSTSLALSRERTRISLSPGSSQADYIPINTTDACKDVERYLQSEFESTQKEFPDSVSKDWPPKASFLKLAATASGLFVFAETAIRFIKDPEYANPVQQLDLILSVLDHVTVASADDQPLFAHLDALYTQILGSISARSWLTTKRLFGFALVLNRSEIKECRKFRPSSQSLRALFIIFGLSQDIIYSCLAKCYSMLAIPPWTDPYDSFRFLHASFSDYLMDSSRSGPYYISISDAEDDFVLSCANLLQDFIKAYPCGLGNTSTMWDQYCAQRYPETQYMNSMSIGPFNEFLFQDIVRVVSSEAIDRHKLDRLGSPVSLGYSQCLDALRNVCSVELWTHFGHIQRQTFVEQMFDAWKESPHQLAQSGLVFETKLKNLSFDHLDNDKMCPAHTRSREVQNFPYQDTCRPSSRDELKTYIDDLRRIQERLPDIQVLMCGATMEGRCAVFCVESWEFTWKRYYIIPHPRRVVGTSTVAHEDERKNNMD